MVRSRAPRPAAPASLPPRSASPWPDALLALGVVAIVLVVFHRATGYFFRSDDFEGLARARGLLPERTGIARLIPWRLYFALFNRSFGLDPFGYHVASLVVQAAAGVLTFAWLHRPAGRWPALVGAAFWAAHPAHYAAVYWISAIGDPLSIAFVLGALIAARSAGPRRWAAVPLFAFALLSKENVLLVPLVTLVDPGRDPALPPARGDPVPWVLAAMSAALVAYYIVFDPIGTRHAGGEAYVPRLGVHVGLNLLAYAGWSASFLAATFRSISDAVEPQFFPAGLALLAGMIGAIVWPAARHRGALAGATLWLAMLIPLLPLAHHTYRYYLCGPLAGLAMVLAAVIAAIRPRPHFALAPAAVVAAALLAWNGYATVQAIEFSPFMVEGMRADAVVDRALIAGRVAAALREDRPPDGVTLRFWSPSARSIEGLSDSSNALGYWEQNVRAAVLDGLGVRVLNPQIRRVEFVPRFEPAADSVWYAVYRADGSMKAGPASIIGQAIERMKDRP